MDDLNEYCIHVYGDFTDDEKNHIANKLTILFGRGRSFSTHDGFDFNVEPQEDEEDVANIFDAVNEALNRKVKIDVYVYPWTCYDPDTYEQEADDKIDKRIARMKE